MSNNKYLFLKDSKIEKECAMPPEGKGKAVMTLAKEYSKRYYPHAEKNGFGSAQSISGCIKYRQLRIIEKAEAAGAEPPVFARLRSLRGQQKSS